MDQKRIKSLRLNMTAHFAVIAWLTAMLVAMAASFSPIMVGVNMAADVVESQVELPANGLAMDLSDHQPYAIH